MNLNKPVSVIRYEFIQQLTNLINGSNLPMFVIEPILKDMHLDVKSLARRQLEKDLDQYRSSIEDHAEYTDQETVEQISESR